MVGLVGFEPTTPALSRRCSNRLSYRPSLIPLGRGPVAARPIEQPISVDVCTNDAMLWKGGDPAAPSDTATLLRLHPSHEPYRGKRPPCG